MFRENLQKRIRKTELPRHAKAFANPIVLSPAGRRTAGITEDIKKYVSGFKARNKLNLARKIVEDIANFEVEALPIERAKQLWAKRSADNVIKTKIVYIIVYSEAARTGKAAILGCNDRAVAVTASLRAIGLKALIVRMRNHTYTKFFYAGKVFIADASDHAINRVREMTPRDKRLENSYRNKKAFAEGASLAQIGIKAYADFFKYDYNGVIKPL